MTNSSPSSFSLSSSSSAPSTPSMAYMPQWKGKAMSKPSTPKLVEQRRASIDLCYTLENTVTKSTPSIATQVVSIAVLSDNKHAAYEQSDPEDWSDADDDEGLFDRQSWFYKPAPIMIPVYKPLYVPSVSYEEHLRILRKTENKRYSPYHKTCYYDKRPKN
ncbi:hypothetical protein CJU90_3319 [Yarrowia sp. C11]|nr:hypothetical protein CKK34_4765 [Yarrowia sp. E02]KAG5369790.1 hypothetical protein CJU90_3319 [Yarrowia sp. C11]